VAITGLERGGELRRIVDQTRRVFAVPRDGLVLTAELARILAVSPGDTVTLELLERGSEARSVPVAAVVDELIGLGGYLELGALNTLMREPPSASGAYLELDPGAEHAVVARLRNIPGVAGTTTQRAMVESFDAQIAASLRITVTIVVSLAIVVALGVIYNGIRISLSERARELASLRVLGFTRREVAALLFGEQVVIDVLGTPLGLLLGLGLAHWIVTGFASETYRFPVVIDASTYLFSTAVIVVAVLGATLAMRGRVYRLDLIGVLKTRE
jgi:putative ABC transport system permease protein